ncbi:hypothetical protein F4776DRAFT_90207 [Hypoxylon sp. NC0597]|nr:hypothetical protein F4776DRAFT_90207 [Hypoxylon sp. NC0597]
MQNARAVARGLRIGSKALQILSHKVSPPTRCSDAFAVGQVLLPIISLGQRWPSLSACLPCSGIRAATNLSPTSHPPPTWECGLGWGGGRWVSNPRTLGDWDIFYFVIMPQILLTKFMTDERSGVNTPQCMFLLLLLLLFPPATLEEKVMHHNPSLPRALHVIICTLYVHDWSRGPGWRKRKRQRGGLFEALELDLISNKTIMYLYLPFLVML